MKYKLICCEVFMRIACMEIAATPNIIDPESFSVINNKELKYTIGYVGSPTRKDGVDDLIKSFALFNKKFSNTNLYK